MSRSFASAIATGAVLTTALLLAQKPAARQPGAQAANGQTGVIKGHVLNASSGEPLRKAVVRLQPNTPAEPGGPSVANGGDDGGFVLDSLPPGEYGLTVERRGFVTQAYGAPPAASTQGKLINVGPGQTIENLDIRMVPQGVITGKVLDDDGEPVERAQVSLWRYDYPDGDRKLVRMPVFPATNDLGEYRIAGLAPGSYILSAATNLPNAGLGAAPASGPVTTYYPRSPDSGTAGQIEVPAGGEVSGADVRLLKSPLFQVRGNILGGPEGAGPRTAGRGAQPVVAVQLQSADGVLSRSGKVNPDGTFVIAQVAPGSYLIRANARDGQQQLAATVPVEVSGRDTEGVNVRMLPLVKISGAIHMDPANTPPPSFSALRLMFRAQHTAQSMSPMVQKDGTLRGGSQLLSDNYRLEVSGIADGYYLKAVKLDGQEVQDAMFDFASIGSAEAAIEIVLSPTSAVLAGTVNNSKGAPAAGMKVTVVPASTATRRDLYLSQNTDQNGNFSFKNLPPGKYRLYAWEQVESNAWMNPQFRLPFENLAAPAELTDNGTVNVMLNLIEGNH